MSFREQEEGGSGGTRTAGRGGPQDGVTNMYLSGVLLCWGASRILPDLPLQKLLLGGPEGQKEWGVTCP